ncbi:ATP-dependent DNA helicase RecG [bacterium]|nr:MAG: ATP-dependent DNA helicase RecG [bacterium]
MNVRLETHLSTLKGVGEVTERELARMGFVTVRDLLDYFPRRYDDFSALKPIAQLRPGLIAVRARVEDVAVRRAVRNRRMVITEAIVIDDTGSLKLTWFHAPYIADQLKTGEEYFFTGELKFKAGVFSVVQPQFERPSSIDRAGKISAIYSETAKINSKILRSLVRQCLPAVDELVDPLPEVVLSTQKLMPLAQAVRELHEPTDTKKLQQAQSRMAFGELFFHMLTSRVLREELETEPGIVVPFNQALAQEFVASLSFSLTNSQRRVSWQIFSDMERGVPMSRLLEGDVGSGKTLVAAFVALMAIRAGFQTAVMVPTVVLGTQHLKSFRDLLKPWGIRVELLASHLKSKQRLELTSAIQAGEVDIVIGTQAIITKNIQFPRLGLVVVDEQHRFGVNQRLSLKDKAGRLPHVLTMTATPIPRTLGLVAFGDLDVSLLTDMPPGRQPVQTHICPEEDRARVYAEIDKRLERGEQAYIVCPAIDVADPSGSRAVKQEMQRLSRTVFRHRRIGLLHGKLKPEEKDAVMTQFASGELDILVATTVIEVGVHVDKASVMLVESADRFGLATLHQLRGRVGRSDIASECYLFTTEDNSSRQRVGALARTNDGFRLAEIDLANRGAGQRFGVRQSGVADFRFASLHDTYQVKSAQKVVDSFLKQEKIVKYPQVIAVVNSLKAVTSLD